MVIKSQGVLVLCHVLCYWCSRVFHSSQPSSSAYQIWMPHANGVKFAHTNFVNYLLLFVVYYSFWWRFDHTNVRNNFSFFTIMSYRLDCALHSSFKSHNRTLGSHSLNIIIAMSTIRRYSQSVCENGDSKITVHIVGLGDTSLQSVYMDLGEVH